MKIEQPSRIGSTTKSKKSKKASSVDGALFSALLDEMSAAAESSPPSEVATSGAVSSAAPISSLDAIIGLQEISDDDVPSERRATRQASLTLDTLEELHRAILLGEVPISKLERIARQVQRQKADSAAVSNPKLQNILDEIEVRAVVELAKYGIEL